MKKVLAIFPQLPLPQYGGDRQKVNNHIKILSKHYNVTAVLIVRSKPTKDDYAFLEQYCSSYKIIYLSKLKIVINLLRGIFSGDALQVAFFHSPDIHRDINKMVEDADFVFCNLIRVAKYAEGMQKPKIIDIVDSISITYKRSFGKVQSLFWKLIYLYDHKHLHKYEHKVMESFDASFLVNYNEQQFWQQKITNRPIVWLPQGTKPELFHYNKTDSKYANSIMFLGKMDYQPNIDAIIWFLKNVWQNVKQDVSFYIVGVNPPDSLLGLAKDDKRIIFTGYIDDPYIIMNSCALVVSPMQTGGGIQNKILEGMAMGRVNVATALCAESIRFAKNKEHIIIVDEPKTMAETINDIVANPSKYSQVGHNAKLMVSKMYTWENFENQMVSVIDNALKTSK